MKITLILFICVLIFTFSLFDNLRSIFLLYAKRQFFYHFNIRLRLESFFCFISFLLSSIHILLLHYNFCLTSFHSLFSQYFFFVKYVLMLFSFLFPVQNIFEKSFFLNDRLIYKIYHYYY